MRWNAPFAPNCAKCAELRRLRRIAPIARCLRRIAPIALELRWNSAYSLAHSHIPMAGAAWLRPPYLQPAVSGQCLSCQAFVAHYSTSSRSPAIFLQLSVMQRDKQCRSRTKMCCYCLPLSFFFWRETTNLASIDVLLVLCAHPEFCAHFGTALGLLYIHNNHMHIDLIDAILFFLRLGNWPKLVANNRLRLWTDGARLTFKSDLL